MGLIKTNNTKHKYDFARIKRRIQTNSQDDDDSITFGIVIFKDDIIVYHYEDKQIWNRVGKLLDQKISHQKYNFIGVNKTDWDYTVRHQNGLLKYTDPKTLNIDFEQEPYTIVQNLFIDKFYNKKYK